MASPSEVVEYDPPPLKPEPEDQVAPMMVKEPSSPQQQSPAQIIKEFWVVLR